MYRICLPPRARQGFTLIELSIVLVVVGLIVGGVMAGQSLIHAADLRNVTREFQEYQTALHAFEDKYVALPGDMPNAVKFWGAQAGGLADGYDSACGALATPATNAATCNGNGNSIIGGTDLGVYPIGETFYYEYFRFWQHLSNAGLIENTYAGNSTHTPPDAGAVIGVNVPRSKFANAGWTIIYPPILTPALLSALYFPAQYEHVFHFGAVHAGSGLTVNPALSGEDAFYIDQKIDDGKPNTGRVLSTRYGSYWSPTCTISTETAYDIKAAGTICSLIFMIGT